MGATIGALHASGHGRRAEGERPQPNARAESMALVRDALADLFEPDRDRLRLAHDQLASLFIGLLFLRPRQPDQAAIPIADVVGTFLHGAFTTPGGDR